MKRRKKMSHRASKRAFKRGSAISRRNLMTHPQRGGIRL